MKEEDKISIFNDIDIKKIKDEEQRNQLFEKKMYKIRELYKIIEYKDDFLEPIIIIIKNINKY